MADVLARQTDPAAHAVAAVMKRFLMDPTPDRHNTVMPIYEAEHLTDEEPERIIASYPAHQRDVWAMGVLVLGSGRIYPIADEYIGVSASPVAEHWPHIGAIDFGWDHATAAARLAWDRDTDCLYVIDCIRKREATPIIHAAALSRRQVFHLKEEALAVVGNPTNLTGAALFARSYRLMRLSQR